MILLLCAHAKKITEVTGCAIIRLSYALFGATVLRNQGVFYSCRLHFFLLQPPYDLVERSSRDTTTLTRMFYRVVAPTIRQHIIAHMSVQIKINYSTAISAPEHLPMTDISQFVITSDRPFHISYTYSQLTPLSSKKADSHNVVRA